jgi:hypothetical protein
VTGRLPGRDLPQVTKVTLRPQGCGSGATQRLYAGFTVSDTTDTPDILSSFDGPEDATAPKSIETLVAEWKVELDGQQSVSATNVQDRLLDLWGQLPEGDTRAEIEQWLTETVQRHLYAVADIDARLQKVLATA